jgi:hypothetical protein
MTASSRLPTSPPAPWRMAIGMKAAELVRLMLG